MSKKSNSIQDQARQGGLIYQGQNGAHLHGIPARGLTPAEVGQLTDSDLQAALESGLYKIHPLKEADES